MWWCNHDKTKKSSSHRWTEWTERNESPSFELSDLSLYVGFPSSGVSAALISSLPLVCSTQCFLSPTGSVGSIKAPQTETMSSEAHTGCCSTENTCCDRKDTVTLDNSRFKGKFPDKPPPPLFFNLLELSLKLGAGGKKIKPQYLWSSQIILQSLVCNYSTTICQLCNYHCEYANSVWFHGPI